MGVVVIAIALAVAGERAEAAYAAPCHDYDEWRATYLAAHRAECELKTACQNLRIPVPRPYLGTLGLERKENERLRRYAAFYSNACHEWAYWASLLLEEAGLPRAARSNAAAQALIAELVRSRSRLI